MLKILLFTSSKWLTRAVNEAEYYNDSSNANFISKSQKSKCLSNLFKS